MPLISVIIPMRNAEPFVKAAVESVLAQGDAELEVIVIDDGSTDRSAEVVRSIGDSRVRVVPGPQKGISAAFNTGLTEARGECLARCDADDLYPPGRLEWQLEFLLEHPEFAAISGAFTTIDARGKTIAEQKTAGAGDVTAELRGGRGRSHVCAYLFRTEPLRQLGGCREFFVTAEDVDLQLRLSEIGRVWYNPKPAYLYRLHDASITHVQKSNERAFFEKCARDFQQQRLTRGQDDLQLGKPPPVPQSKSSGATSSRQQIQRILLGQAWAAHSAGQKGEGVKLGLRAWLTNPLRPSVWRSVIALILKQPQKA